LTNTVDQRIKEATKYFNKREYEQFILPIIKAMEVSESNTRLQEVTATVRNILTSALSKLRSHIEIVGDEDFVKYEDVDRFINQEIQVYLTR